MKLQGLKYGFLWIIVLSKQEKKSTWLGEDSSACKTNRVFYVVLQTGCDFDEERFIRDIIRAEID